MKRIGHNRKPVMLVCLQAGVFCLMMSIAANLSAQHYIGTKGSWGFNSVDALPRFDRRQLETFSPGILYRYEHQKYAALQIETNYIHKGYIREIDTVTMTPEKTFRITSFELPLMAQGFIRFGAFRPYVTAGVYAGYILERSIQETGKTQQKYEFDEYDRRFEYGITGGGGVGVSLYRFELQAECRYQYNFSFLRSPVIPKQLMNTYINSTQLMFSVSLLYRLSK
jgi:hypothetical protein